MATTATNPENSATLTALDTLAVRLAALEAAHAREVAVLRDEFAALGAASAQANGRAQPEDGGARRARPLARFGRTPARPAGREDPPRARRSTRRGMLGTAAKVAAATVAAGVLAEQVGTDAAYADNLGNFSSSVNGTPAVSAAGTNGATGINASSDTGNAIVGNGARNGVYGTAGAGSGVYGLTSAANANGVYGINITNGGIAVLGHSDEGGLIPGLLGAGIGVQGETASGTGVNGTATTGTGVNGTSISGSGVTGATGGAGANAIFGANTSNTSGSVAVFGHSDDGIGGLGPGIGVQGETASGQGVRGTATTGSGVYGLSTSGTGVIGVSNSGDAIGALSSSGNALYGLSAGGDGAYGQTGASAAYGLHGVNTSNSTSSIAVLGHSDDGSGNLGPGIGVQGETAGGKGVYGTATTGVGVYGTTAGGARTQAMYAVGTSGSTGLRATSDSGNGLVALSTTGTGINVQSSTGSAVVATSNGVGYGLYLTAPLGWAIGCVGRIRVIGAAVGTVTLAHGTTTKTVSSTACSGGSQVILTPTTNPGVFIWAVAAPGAFTIHASSAPSSDVTFSYLLIN